MAINVGNFIIISEQSELVATPTPVKPERDVFSNVGKLVIVNEQPTASEPVLTEVVEGNDEVTIIVDHNERRRRMKENLLAETVKSSPYMDDMSVIPNYK